MVKIKKLLCVLLTGIFMVNPFTNVFAQQIASAAAAVNEITEWDGTTDRGWYDAEETEYHIGTAEELAGLAELVNLGNDMAGKTIYLDNDILLNSDPKKLKVWKTIGTVNYNSKDQFEASSSKGFAGCFDGQNHSIYGLIESTGSRSMGLFGYITEKGSVLHLTIDNKKNSAFENYSLKITDNTGFIAGRSDGYILDCHTKLSSITYTGSNVISGPIYAIGGIVGATGAGKIEQCSFSGNITINTGHI